MIREDAYYHWKTGGGDDDNYFFSQCLQRNLIPMEAPQPEQAKWPDIKYSSSGKGLFSFMIFLSDVNYEIRKFEIPAYRR